MKMVNLLFLIILGFVLSSKAEGPLYKQKDTYTQQEFDNVYQDLRNNRNSSPAKLQNQTSTGTYCDQIAGNAKNGLECYVNGVLFSNFSGDFELYIDTNYPTVFLQGAISAGMPTLQPRSSGNTNPWSLGTSTFKWTWLYVSSGIAGTIINDEAPAGAVAEWSTGTYTGAYANSAPSNQYTAFSTVTIPSGGDWMVCGTIQTNLNGATMTRNRMALSQSPGNATGDQISGKNDIDIPIPSATSSPGQQLCYRFETTVATTIYIKTAANFSAGQPQYLGYGWATRRR